MSAVLAWLWGKAANISPWAIVVAILFAAFCFQSARINGLYVPFTGLKIVNGYKAEVASLKEAQRKAEDALKTCHDNVSNMQAAILQQNNKVTDLSKASDALKSEWQQKFKDMEADTARLNAYLKTLESDPLRPGESECQRAQRHIMELTQ